VSFACVLGTERSKEGPSMIVLNKQSLLRGSSYRCRGPFRATAHGPLLAARSAGFGPSVRLAHPAPCAKISIVVLGEPA